MDPRRNEISEEECIGENSILQAHRHEETWGSVWGGTGCSPCSRLSFRPSSFSRASSSPGSCLNFKRIDAAPGGFLRGTKACHQIGCCWERGRKPRCATAPATHNPQTPPEPEVDKMPYGWGAVRHTRVLLAGVLAVQEHADTRRGERQSGGTARYTHLDILARLCHGIEDTTCQADRNFSALSFLISNLRSSIGVFKIEPCA